ncbi:hypothetical protein [Salmonella phage SSBI34]|nr:hypothetical protein [Salmonella phage SSBI34]
MGKDPALFGVDSSFNSAGKNIVALGIRGYGRKIDTTTAEYLSVGMRSGSQIIANGSQLLNENQSFANGGSPSPDAYVTNPDMSRTVFMVSGAK